MQLEPQKEHHWLDRLLGEWTSEMECSMGSDQPPAKTTGTEVVRSLGGLWAIAEGTSEMPDGAVGRTIMTLGYDPKREHFVGSFIGSMMTHMWIYNGTLDASENVLTLDTEGPDFSQSAMTKYKDIIEFVDDDHRTLTSRIRIDDGSWNQFMVARYRRQK